MNEEKSSFEDRFRIEKQGLDDAPVSGKSRYSRRRSRSVSTIKVIALAGMVIAFFVVLVIVFKSSGGKTNLAEKEQVDPVAGNMAMITLLEQRMERMEGALAGMAEKLSAGKAGPASEADINVFSGRVERLETAMSAKFSIIAENLDKLDVQMADVVSRLKTLEKGGGVRTIVRQKSQFSSPSLKTSVSPEVATVKTSVANTSEKKIAIKKNKPATKKKATSNHIYHVVQKGETFYSISRKYNTTVENIHKLNHFAKQPTIYPGDKLIVK